MKQILTTFALAAIVAPTIQAGVFDTYSLDPAPGTVESIHAFTLTYPDTEGYTDLTWGIKATLTLPDGSSVESGNWQQVIQGISFEFGETYTAPGEYSLSIPEGWLFQNGEQNPALTVSYTVGGTQEIPELPDNFHDGILMLNEDWFGHASSSMNFIANDGTVYYDVYKGANPDKCLGNTSQYGQVFGDRVFVMSKQNYSSSERSGGRFIAMNASDLSFLGELETLPGGDGRGFCAVSATKGYLGTSEGMFAIDLETYEASSTQLAPAAANGRIGQTGEMVRYGNRLFAAQQNTGVLAVDIATDEVTLIELPKVATVFVTADGTIYAANSDADAEFTAIDPETLATTTVDIEGSHAISSPWGTWRASSLAADTEKNVVYYVSGGGWTPRTACAYDFDSKEFTEAFASVPEGQSFYGQGISIDPKSGNLLMTATENGYGEHYSHNWVYFADTATGEIIADKTIKLKDYYWFPAMMLYPDFEAPELAISEISLSAGETIEVNLDEATTLATGNRHLIVYSAETTDGNICTATATAGGKITLTGVTNGTTTLTVSADYQGRIATAEVAVNVTSQTGIEEIISGSEAEDAPCDVYNAAGILVIRNATAEDIRGLERGFYIVGGRKVVVR